MHGVNEHSVSVEIGGRTVTYSTGKYAKQAGGAIHATCGETHLLATAVCGTKPSRFDFLPLTVDYIDKDGASGKIPGGFLKREGRGNERTTLTSRLIDRPIRPMFPKNFRAETQLIATVMSFDKDAEADWLALGACSGALHVSDAPQSECVAGVRVCEVDGELVLNPDFEGRVNATLNIIVAGTKSAVSMVEGGGLEVSEERMLEAIYMGHAAVAKLIGALDELREKAGVPKRAHEEAAGVPAEEQALIDEKGIEALRAAFAFQGGKHEKSAAMKAARNGVIDPELEGLDDEAAEARREVLKAAWAQLVKKEMRRAVMEENRRIDGREPATIRPIWCEAGVAPKAHGSAVFTRGETQAFVTAALGTERDNQRIDWAGALRPTREWMLTYSFPPFCTGEARPLRAPKRREVGHGALAHRALQAVLPSFDEFPYVMRCTSDVLESNGSSSMATVCGATLSLMDAGVPLKAPVAGIAMGLIKEGDGFAVISDILGSEDALGDMDFKVTGTREGITAFQMDVKIAGVDEEIMKAALAQAREGRLHILDEMGKTLDAPRAELSDNAPRITTIQIKPDKIRDIIGPGGKTIRGIQDKTGTQNSVDDSGKVQVAATDQASADAALAMIKELTQEAELGKLYMGVVKRVVDFGAFVEIFPGTDGLVHVSHLAKERVNKVTDVVNEGDEVLVRVIDIDRSGKIRLSRKEAIDASAGAF